MNETQQHEEHEQTARREQAERRRQYDPHDADQTREERQSLWLLWASPLIWAAHFLASYLTVAIWCEKAVEPDGPLGAARLAIAVYTAIALIGIVIVAGIGLRRHSFGAATVPHDFDTPEDRHRFLGFAALLLSSLSAVATIFVSLAAVFMDTCE